MIPPAPQFACRYALKTSGWTGEPATILFIVEDMDVEWNDEAPEIMGCAVIDVVAVV